MIGDKAVAAGIAGPQIADDIVRKESRGLRGDHAVGADRAGREIGAARRRARRILMGRLVLMGRLGRADFSGC